MSTRYDIYIKVRGYFNFFKQPFHAPGIVYGVTKNHLDVLEQLHWLYDILNEYDDDKDEEIIYYPENKNQFIVPTENAIDKISNIQPNDRITVLCTLHDFIYI